MKNFQILTISILLTTFVSAQDQKFSATLGYPVPVGDNFLVNYSGVADLGLQFRFIKTGALNIGLSTNASYYSESTTLSTVTLKESAFLVQPRAFVEIDSETLNGFRPFLGLGYSFINTKIKFENGQQDDEKDSTEGLNVNLGLGYDITDSFMAYLSYDYLNFSRDNPNHDNDFFTNGSILKLGVGLRF